jgi:hypothetical protein
MMESIWRISITRDDITLAIAILGAALGILNSVRLWWRDRVRLKVIPKLYASIGGAIFRWPKHDEAFLKQHLKESPRFCIEVQNPGANAVTVATVGFLRRRSTRILAINNPIIRNGGKYPRRLEPHSSFEVYTRYTPVELKEEFGIPYCAFAETASGRKFRGTSPVLKDLAKVPSS